jgi:predicted phosphodiesterase
MLNETLEKRLDKLSDKEIELLLSHLHDEKIEHKTYEHKFSKKHAKFLIVSDTHMGIDKFDEGFWFYAFKYAKQQGIDTAYHAGDIFEGMSGREGHIYELAHVGFNEQMKYAEYLFSNIGMIVYGITGNHDDWYLNKNNAGVNVGEELRKRCSNFFYLGRNEADIMLTDNVKMKLFHPNDGSAYAPGYKLMKLAESFGGGEKPSILFQGHYHKALYMFNRNIHMYEAGTFCGQTEFMRGKKLAAHKGFWIVDAYFNKTGVERIKNTFIPKYD